MSKEFFLSRKFEIKKQAITLKDKNPEIYYF